ncbi:UNVERIFIED_ORG: hypothetical protein GGI63_000869 [Rhizobium esperanzae]
MSRKKIIENSFARLRVPILASAATRAAEF